MIQVGVGLPTRGIVAAGLGFGVLGCLITSSEWLPLKHFPWPRKAQSRSLLKGQRSRGGAAFHVAFSGGRRPLHRGITG